MFKKNKYRKSLTGCLFIAGVLILGIILYGSYTKNTESAKIYTEEEIVNAAKEQELVIEDNGITYTFLPEGTLLVSGSGETKSFSSVQEAKEWYLTELYHAYSGRYPEKEEHLLAFRCVLDNVTGIELAEGITVIGDCAFTPFYYVKSVSAPETVNRVGTYAFLGAGQYEEEELMLFGFVMETMDYSAESFALSPVSLTLETGEEGYCPEELPVRPKEEQGTVPDEELLVAKVYMGEHIEYCLYENGVLYVTGTGTTFDFEYYSEMESYIMEKLKLSSRQEVQTKWFNRVTELFLDDGIERIGDNALALYENVSYVSGGSLKELGERAFFRMGRDRKEEIVWDTDFTDTAYAETAFFNCRNIPESLTEKDTE